MSAKTRARLLSLGLTALLAVTLLFGAAGGAAAADVELANETVGIDADTQSVYAEVDNTGDADASLSVEFIGVDSDGNETGTLNTQDVVVGAGNETLVEYTDLNVSAYSEVKVIATLDNTTASAENVSVSTGTIQKVAGGGGGGFLDGAGGKTTTVGLIVLVLVVVLLARSDD